MTTPFFPRLEPPPGGLALLRERLDRPRAGHPWLWGFPVAAAAAVAAVLLVVPPSSLTLEDRMAGDPSAQALGLAPRPHGVEGVAATAVRRLESSNPAVVLYWIDGAAPRPD